MLLIVLGFSFRHFLAKMPPPSRREALYKFDVKRSFIFLRSRLYAQQGSLREGAGAYGAKRSKKATEGDPEHEGLSVTIPRKESFLYFLDRQNGKSHWICRSVFFTLFVTHPRGFLFLGTAGTGRRRAPRYPRIGKSRSRFRPSVPIRRTETR